MAQYRTVEGEGSATVNTIVALTTFGADTGVGPVKVPDTASRIVEIWVAIGADTDTAGDSTCHFLRLAGLGLVDAPVDLVIAASGGGVTSTGTVLSAAMVYKVSLTVKKNETISVSHQYTGDTTGAVTLGVTLVFE